MIDIADNSTADEERKGLLSGVHSLTPERDEDAVHTHSSWLQKSWSDTKVAGVAVACILLLISGTFAHTFLLSRPRNASGTFHFNDVASNGTHDFKRTVLIVSIDGLRADYLDRGLTPHLLDIARKGLRAKFMRPVFPTLTFPNHWSLMTGLYAEIHGIVGNNFWDPATNSEFHYNNIRSSWNSSWWFGEPMWETAEKAGVATANLMWPGPPKTSARTASTYFVPYRDHVSLDDKLHQILNWIDLPFEQRPQLILAYEPSLDQAGHKAGPMSTLVNATLAEVDLFAKKLHNSLDARNLTEIVDVIFVSDHGMADTSHPELVYIDDILGDDGFKAIEHTDGWPSMGLRFYPEANASHYLDLLLEAAGANPEKFDVYTHDTMPQYYHFAHNERIAPIYVVPKLGYALSHRGEGDVGMSKGNHGYDNHYYQMHAIFVAHGPFPAVTKALHQSSTSAFSRSISRPNKGWHSTSDDTYVMNGFQNVEVYNLVMKLLAIEDRAARTNGTDGFWNMYF